MSSKIALDSLQEVEWSDWKRVFVIRPVTDIVGEHKIRGLVWKREARGVYDLDRGGYIHLRLDQYVKHKKDLFKASLSGILDKKTKEEIEKQYGGFDI